MTGETLEPEPWYWIPLGLAALRVVNKNAPMPLARLGAVEILNCALSDADGRAEKVGAANKEQWRPTTVDNQQHSNRSDQRRANNDKQFHGNAPLS